MYKNLVKNILILIFPIINIHPEIAFAHKKSDIKNKVSIGVEKLEKNSKINSADNEFVTSSENNIDANLMRSFNKYPTYEESVGPINQFINLFRNNDMQLKKSVFSLWETYEKEMSNQIGRDRLNGKDINNTFNESLNSLSK